MTSSAKNKGDRGQVRTGLLENRNVVTVTLSQTGLVRSSEVEKTKNK